GVVVGVAGEGAGGEGGRVVDKGGVGNSSPAMSDGNIGRLEAAVGIVVADAQFANLRGAAGDGILMAFAAGLRVVERAKALADLLKFIKLGQVGLMGGFVHHAVGFVVESGWRIGWRGRGEKKKKTDSSRGEQELHSLLHGTNREPGADIWITLFGAETKRKKRLQERKHIPHSQNCDG